MILPGGAMHIFHKWKAVSVSHRKVDFGIGGADQLKAGLGEYQTSTLYACGVSGCSARTVEHFPGRWELEDFAGEPAPAPAQRNSCLANSGADEPIFVLCARDMTAPYAVMGWADKAERHGVNMQKVDGARAIADAMLAWQRQHPDLVKLPD